jgi:hypothetical protein
LRGPNPKAPGFAGGYLLITPLFFSTIIFRRSGAPESAIHQVNTVQLLIDKGGFTNAQRQLIWRSLIEKYLRAIEPDISKEAKLSELIKESVEDIQKRPASKE